MNTNIFNIGTNLDLKGFNIGFENLMTQIRNATTQFANMAKAGNAVGFTGGVDAFVSKLTNMGVKGKALTDGIIMKFREMGIELEGVGNKALFADAKLATVAKRVMLWSIATAAIFGAVMKLKEAVQYTKELSGAMANLQMVLPKGSDTKHLRDMAFTLGTIFGYDPKDIVEIFRTFAQAGLDVNDILLATKATLTGVNTTGATQEEVITSLITAIKVFGYTWQDATIIIDKVMKLQANYVVEAKDLIAAVQTAGPAIEALGGSLDELFGMITAVVEVTRMSGKEVANAFKFMFARIPTEDTVKALQELKINVYETKDSFRPLTHIFSDLAAIWPKLGEATMINIAKVLTASRQYNKTLALMKAWPVAIQATTDSLTAWGDSAEANAIRMQALDKRFEKLSVDFKKFGVALSEAGIIQFLETLTRMFANLAGTISSVMKFLDGWIVKVGLSALTSVVMIKGLRWVLGDLGLTGAKLSATYASMQKAGEEAAKAASKVGESAVKSATGVMALWSSLKVLFAIISTGVRSISNATWLGFGINLLLAVGMYSGIFKKLFSGGKTAIKSLQDDISVLEARLKRLEDIKVFKNVSTDVQVEVTSPIEKISALVEAMQIVSKETLTSVSSYDSLETALNKVGISVTNLTGDYEEQKKVMNALAAARGFLVGWEFKPISDAISKFENELRTAFEKFAGKVFEIKPTIDLKGSFVPKKFKDLVSGHIGKALKKDIEDLYYGETRVKSFTQAIKDSDESTKDFGIKFLQNLVKIGVSVDGLGERIGKVNSTVWVVNWTKLFADRSKSVDDLANAFLKAAFSGSELEKVTKLNVDILAKMMGLNVADLVGQQAQAYEQLKKVFARAMEIFKTQMMYESFPPAFREAIKMMDINIKRLLEGSGAAKGMTMEMAKLGAIARTAIRELEMALAKIELQFRQTSIDAIELGQAAQKAGIGFDWMSEVSSAARTALGELDRLYGDWARKLEENREKLSQLQDQEKNTLIESEKQDLVDKIALQEDIISMIVKEMEAYKSDNRVMKFRLELLKIMDMASGKLVETYGNVSKVMSEMTNKIGEMGIEYDKLFGTDKITILTKELSLIELQRQAELDQYNLEVKRGAISEDLAKANTDLINLKYDNLRIEKELNTNLDIQKEKYGGITSDTESIRSSVADWLTDSDALVEDVSKTRSGLHMISRLLKPITQVFAKRRAEIIVKGFLPDDTGKLTHQFMINAAKESGDILGKSAQDSITRASKLGSKNYYEEILKASVDGSQKYYEKIVEAQRFQMEKTGRFATPIEKETAKLLQDYIETGKITGTSEAQTRELSGAINKNTQEISKQEIESTKLRGTEMDTTNNTSATEDNTDALNILSDNLGGWKDVLKDNTGSITSLIREGIVTTPLKGVGAVAPIVAGTAGVAITSVADLLKKDTGTTGLGLKLSLTDALSQWEDTTDRVISRLESKGWQPRIAEEFRIVEQQAEKIKLGYAKPASLYKSPHLVGLGADVIDKRYGWNPPEQYWTDLADAVRAEGAETGADFKTFYDPAHMQMKGWQQYLGYLGTGGKGVGGVGVQGILGGLKKPSLDFNKLEVTGREIALPDLPELPIPDRQQLVSLGAGGMMTKDMYKMGMMGAASKVELKKIAKQSAIIQAGEIAGSIGGGMLAKSLGKSGEFVSLFSGLGPMAASMGLVNPLLGAGLGIVGGLFGGLLGGDIEKDNNKELKDLNKKTAEVIDNTSELVDKLSPEMFNVPSTWFNPVGGGFGGGSQPSGNNINITINGGNGSPVEVAREVENTINKIFYSGYTSSSTQPTKL